MNSPTVPVALTVWPFTLPSTASLQTAFGLAWGALPSRARDQRVGRGGVRDASARATASSRSTTASRSRTTTTATRTTSTTSTRYYGPLMDGDARRRGSRGAQLTAVEYLGNLEDTARMARLGDHYRARQGWLDRLFQYTCDEPPPHLRLDGHPEGRPRRPGA